jgi:hypothetical protein
MTILLSGSFVGVGVSAAVTPRADLTAAGFNVHGFGVFVGTVRLEKSIDNGANWRPLTLAGVATSTWTAPWSERQIESEQGVLYRYNCTAYTSGTASNYISQ